MGCRLQARKDDGAKRGSRAGSLEPTAQPLARRPSFSTSPINHHQNCIHICIPRDAASMLGLCESFGLLFQSANVHSKTTTTAYRSNAHT
jgi:hypothetical protein